MNGWIKLHRSLLNNPLWQRDHTAVHVFLTLLLSVDSKTGSFTCGRHQMEALTGIKGTTYYKALGRLKFHQMVTQVSNNRFTTISICKWKDYQSSGNSQSNTRSNNQVTTKEQQSNTKQEVKNIRNKKDTKVSTANAVTLISNKVDKRNPDIQQVIDTWLQVVGDLDGPQAEHRRYAKLLLDKKGLEAVLAAIRAIPPTRGQKYAHSFTSIQDLYRKYEKLREFYIRKKVEQNDPEKELTNEELKRKYGL